MRTILVGACLTAAACGDLPTSGVPGLRGFVTTASSDRPEPSVLARIGEWRAADADCAANAYGGIAVTGDLGAGAKHPQTVLATFDELVVVDANDELVAAAPTEFACTGGSADALEIVAIGRTWLDVPMIAIAATIGGRAEQSTYVALFRVAGGRLVPMFRGAVEAREGDDVFSGSITIVPEGLVYRAPGDPATWWRLDHATGRYVQPTRDLARS